MKLIEKIIVRKLIKELDAAGFVPVQFWDGGEYQAITWKNDSTDTNEAQRERACLAAIDSVDQGTLHFAPKTDIKAWGGFGVLLILGNGEDIISDYHCGNSDFTAAVDRVGKWIDDSDGDNWSAGRQADAN